MIIPQFLMRKKEKYNSQKSFQRTTVIYPDDNNLNSDGTNNAEQLIIYPNIKENIMKKNY